MIPGTEHAPRQVSSPFGFELLIQAATSPFTLIPFENPTQGAALDLFDRGFNIGPTKPGQKIPFKWRVLVGTRIDRRYIAFLFDNGSGIFVVVGRLSMNLAILDADTLEAAERQAAEFDKRGLRPWRVNTARGAHFWFLCSEGELANIAGDGWQLWGSMHYCLCPPSVHPTGLIYEWAERIGDLPPLISLAQLDWLPLKTRAAKRRQFDPDVVETNPLACLSKRNLDFIEQGAAEHTRNTRLFAAACDMAGNDFPLEQALDTLTPAAIRSGLPYSEVVLTIKKAYSQERTPAKSRPLTARALPTWRRAQLWATSRKWATLHADGDAAVSGPIARDVFLALCERSRRDSADVFRASQREVAELANVDQKTVRRALKCLICSGYIASCGLSATGTGLFAFSQDVLRHAPNTPSGSDVSGAFCNTRSDARADIFRPGALGRAAERVWLSMLPPNPPATKAEIARRAGCSRSTATRLLSAHGLPKWGLASEISPGLWIGNAADDRYLLDVAVKSGTSGRAADRRRKHATERALYASELILKAKRAWENKHLRRVTALDDNGLC